jgi:hypothetical protein
MERAGVGGWQRVTVRVPFPPRFLTRLRSEGLATYMHQYIDVMVAVLAKYPQVRAQSAAAAS